MSAVPPSCDLGAWLAAAAESGVVSTRSSWTSRALRHASMIAAGADAVPVADDAVTCSRRINLDDARRPGDSPLVSLC